MKIKINTLLSLILVCSICSTMQAMEQEQAEQGQAEKRIPILTTTPMIGWYFKNKQTDFKHEKLQKQVERKELRREVRQNNQEKSQQELEREELKKRAQQACARMFFNFPGGSQYDLQDELSSSSSTGHSSSYLTTELFF